MARILCVTSDLTGLLYSSLELARRLVADGHDVCFAGPAGARQTVCRQGFTFLPVDLGGYERFVQADALRPIWARVRSVLDRRRQAARAMRGDDFGHLLREVDPDLVLVDAELHAQIMIAVAAGRRTALLVTFVSIWRRPGLPPPHALVRPGHGWRGTAMGTWLLWSYLRLRKCRVRVGQWIRTAGCDPVSVLAQVARDVGFDFARGVDATQWLIPFTYRDLPAFCLHAVEFEFPHEPPGHVTYVGPLVADARGDGGGDASALSRLGPMLERRRSGPSGRRLIYAGFGSFFTVHPSLIQRLIAAVAVRHDWDLVLSLGRRGREPDLGPLPANVCVCGWVPQLDVLRAADAAVIHGGINTVDECVLSGVPMLVYCGFETDMGGTAARVAHHGLGIVGDGIRDSSDEIGRRIDRLVTDHGFKTNVERLRRQYVAYRTDRVAERAVAALLADSPGVFRAADLANRLGEPG